MDSNAPDAIPADVRRIAEDICADPGGSVSGREVDLVAKGILADRASRSPLAAPVAEGWRDMESAPKGEKWKHPKILLWDGRRARIGYWNEDEYAKKPRPFWAYTGSFGKTDDRASQPTHWMPLPAPPAAAPSGTAEVEVPYAHEYGRTNGDGTYSVVIERGEPRNPVADWPVKPLFTHPPTVEVREPDAELVRALSGLVTAVGKMRVPQNVSDVALLVMVTLGPALSHAQDILSKHGGNQ